MTMELRQAPTKRHNVRKLQIIPAWSALRIQKLNKMPEVAPINNVPNQIMREIVPKITRLVT